MTPRLPIAELSTHSVMNMPPHLGDQDLWKDDIVLREWVKKFDADWAETQLAQLGEKAGAAEVFEKADAANHNRPKLKAFDRYGMRINQVEFHPTYHDLMDLAIHHEVANFAWRHESSGAQVAHMALSYIFSQVEGGVMCPMAMTYSAFAVLRANAEAANDWLPKLLSTSYDCRDIPVIEKTGATIGMFMTEKQGGSDVRANSTRAMPVSTKTGQGCEYVLNGHKFFCSAPMSDAFLTLAHTDIGLSCFLVPRWKPDEQRNNLAIQRLKDKLGNHSNASSEMEFEGTWGMMIGDEGRGIRTIIDMVAGTRIYCATSSAAMMRQALVQALHYTSHRSAFQKLLIEQLLMRNVLADLAIEVEAALALVMRIAKAMEKAEVEASEGALARIGTAIAKYWICKRAPNHIFEALECHGGSGYIEESMMPRLYREAPVNSIWEGSGNVMCLDVLRTMHRDPIATQAFLNELEIVKTAHPFLNREIEYLKDELLHKDDLEVRARELTERMAVALQAALLLRYGPTETADAFCQSRLGQRWSGNYGVLPSHTNFEAIINRAMPLK